MNVHVKYMQERETGATVKTTGMGRTRFKVGLGKRT